MFSSTFLNSFTFLQFAFSSDLHFKYLYISCTLCFLSVYFYAFYFVHFRFFSISLHSKFAIIICKFRSTIFSNESNSVPSKINIKRNGLVSNMINRRLIFRISTIKEYKYEYWNSLENTNCTTSKNCHIKVCSRSLSGNQSWIFTVKDLNLREKLANNALEKIDDTCHSCMLGVSLFSILQILEPNFMQRS